MKATLSMSDNHAPMESMSMSRSQYPSYESVKPKRNYGEPIPSVYVPPRTKFESSTTTGETFKGIPGNLIFIKTIFFRHCYIR